MGYELYFRAIERAIAGLIAQFQETPNLYWQRADLQGAAYHALVQTEPLARRVLTRDGRWTGLVHLAYPPLLAYLDGLEDPARPGPAAYDVVVLHPGFVRGHRLEVVAHPHLPLAQRLRDLPADQRPTPLLAAIFLELLEALTPATLQEVEDDFHALVRAEPDALRRYLVLFCRQWELDEPFTQALKTITRWAANQPEISLVLVQSYADEAGRVFGGRYFNLWSHTAPLPPLAPAPSQSRL